ncbi:MAG: hypothetical protein OXI79_07445 [Gammaproteobacteria bacterium]|nr:hypothetical protein [Gammaproteobacteria bacterium]
MIAPRTAAAALIVASLACTAAVPETGQEIADAMPGLDLKHPDIHAKLIGGAFDAMTGTDRIDTLLEIWRRESIAGGMEVVQADALVDTSLVILKHHPISSAIERAVKRALAAYRPKTQPDTANDTGDPSEPIVWWYAYSDDQWRYFLYRIKDTAFTDACSVCLHTEGHRGPPTAVMRVTAHSVGGNRVVCADCDL